MNCTTTIVSLLFSSWLSHAIAQVDSTDVCYDLNEKYTTCIVLAPDSEFDGEETGFDNDCSTCLTTINNFQFDATNCNDASKEICSYYEICSNECFDKNIACADEYYAYSICTFGKYNAPDNCLIQCDGITDGSGGGGGGGGGGGNNYNYDDLSSEGLSSTLIYVLSACGGGTVLAVAGYALKYIANM